MSEKRENIRNTIFLVAVIFFFAAIPGFVCAQSRLENSGNLLYSHTLENGLSLFVTEDSSSALVHVEFVVRAGFSSQETSTSGFAPLYVRLFPTTAERLNDSVFSLIPLKAECLADSASFSASVPPESLEKYLEALAECSVHPVFTDSVLKREYEALKKETESYKDSTAGFINSAIDSRVFADAPWKQESGIYPSLFSNRKISEVRSVLASIGNTLYVPQNSAIFVSGNCKNEEVFRAVKEYFSNWEGSSRFSPKKYAWKETNPQRKFVLTSPYFSPDMTQIVVQFTSLSMSECDILSSAFNNYYSSYKTNLVADKKLGLRGRDYLAASSAQKNGSSRFILQALLEKELMLGNKPCTEQAKRFVTEAKEAASLSRSDFIRAQNEIAFKYRIQQGSSVTGTDSLSQVWALSGATNDANFYETFLNLAHDAQSKKEKDIEEKIKKEEPFIFLLVSDSVFAEQKASFEKEGYERITEKNASWYADELLAQKARAEAEAAPKKDDLLLSSIINSAEVRAVENFYFKNSSQIFSSSLTNGIPVTCKVSPGTQSVLLSICIAGGELSSPKKERLLRTVLINAFARNIQGEISRLRYEKKFCAETKLKAWTEETSSYITLSCVKEDFAASLEAVSNAIVYGELTPVNVDNLVSEQAYQWNMKSASLGFQLRNNALSYLYRGTDFSRLFAYDSNSPILQDTTFQTVTLAYTRLLDASLYSLVVVGDVSEEEAFACAEKSFGVLKEQGIRSEAAYPSPSFKNKTRNVQLRHLYSTDKTPDLAPDGVPILVPTEEFFDPAQFYFSAPKDSLKMELFNAVLFELNRRTSMTLGKDYPCSAIPAKYEIPVGMLQASDLKNASLFLTAYQSSYRKVLKLLSEDSDDEARCIRSLWEAKVLEKTQDNEGTAALIQEGLNEGRAIKYLDSYLAIENATAEDFKNILTTYFTVDPLFKVYSVDSKK